MTPDQETQLQHLDTEIQIAEKRLRLVQIKKQIVETELDIVALQQSLQQSLQQELGERTPVPAFARGIGVTGEFVTESN